MVPSVPTIAMTGDVTFAIAHPVNLAVTVIGNVKRRVAIITAATVISRAKLKRNRIFDSLLTGLTRVCEGSGPNNAKLAISRQKSSFVAAPRTPSMK
jgi:hypothetical protein